MKLAITVFLFTLYVTCAVARSPPKPGCDGDSCPGPLKLYKELGCQPIKRNPDDCCAMKYDCDHLKSRSHDKCYAFGNEYNPTEAISKEDTGCLPTCTCIKIEDEKATWACASVYIPVSTAAGCYHPRNATMCFPGPETCPPNPEDIPKCEVDGKTFEDGDYFEPEGKPKKACWCGPGYKGENTMPFCRNMKDERCGYELKYRSELEKHCAPVWKMEQEPAVECNPMWRCQKAGDEITPREKALGVPENDTPDPVGMTCRIGDLNMRLGDELNEISADGPDCIKCVCEIPPVATCAKIPKSVCLMTAEDLNDSDEKKS
ncbi:uncharacterized protein LOC107043577 [Diachasma alloeum]|uniref:uncharacterized protein LOC107043577 n=1 Tax=Diachasma alloeum TaxID=454923 RepID=UPI0007383DAD|nr:uncharacterized protein LOC107043577 [Diachasma alloeum]